MDYYSQLHEAYGWTLKEIDDTDLEYLMDLIIVKDKTTHKRVFIDEIF